MRYSQKWIKICTPEEIVLFEEVSQSKLGVSSIETGYGKLTGLSPGSPSVDQIKRVASSAEGSGQGDVCNEGRAEQLCSSLSCVSALRAQVLQEQEEGSNEDDAARDGEQWATAYPAPPQVLEAPTSVHCIQRMQ